MSKRSLRRKQRRLQSKIDTRKRKLHRTILSRAIHAVNLTLHNWFPWIQIQDKELRRLMEKHDHIKQKLQDVEDSYSRSHRGKKSYQSPHHTLVVIAALAILMVIGHSFDGLTKLTEASPVKKGLKNNSRVNNPTNNKKTSNDSTSYTQADNLFQFLIPRTRRVRYNGQLFQVVKVPGDGCCFYHSVRESDPTHTVQELRNLTANYINMHRAEFSADGISKATLDRIIQKIRTPGEYAEGPAIHAIQKVLNRQIIVLDHNGNRINMVTRNDVSQQNPIFIMYQGFREYYHYEALRKI